MKKILFLQPRSYFERLGVDFSKANFHALFHSPMLYYGKIEPDVFCVISCLDHSVISRYIGSEYRKNGIPFYLIMDGVFEWSNAVSNPFLKKLGVKLLSPIFYDGVLCVDAGLNNMLNELDIMTLQYSSGILAENSEGSGFLVTTANSAYFNEVEYRQMIVLLKKIINTLKLMNLTVRYRVFDNRIVNDLSIPVDENIISGDFSNCVKPFAAVVTTPSTIAQTAMEMDKPVCILDYRDGPLFLQTGWRFHDSIDAATVILSMVGRDPDRMGYQRDAVSRLDINKALTVVLDKKDGYFSNRNKKIDLKKDIFIISFDFPVRYFISHVKVSMSGVYKKIKRLL